MVSAKVWILLVASSASWGKLTVPPRHCGKDGWTCDCQEKEVIYDCGEISESTLIDSTKINKELRRAYSLWVDSPWDTTRNQTISLRSHGGRHDIVEETYEVQKISYKNCFRLQLDLRSGDHVIDSLTVRNVANLRIEYVEKNCGPHGTDDCSNRQQRNYDRRQRKYDRPQRKNKRPNQWPKHLDLQNIGSFTTKYPIYSRTIRNFNMRSVNLTDDSLIGRLENTTVSMTDVTFNSIYLVLKNGNLTMRRSSINPDAKFPSIYLECDTFLFEDNAVKEVFHYFFDLNVRNAIITGNTFGHVHAITFRDMIRSRTTGSPTSLTRFVFSNNKMTQLEEGSLEGPYLDSDMFDVLTVENNTIDCGCRNIKFLKGIQNEDQPENRLIYSKNFADKNFCLAGPKCKKRKINSVKNLEDLCAGNHTDDQGCLMVDDEDISNDDLFVRANSSRKNEETKTEIGQIIHENTTKALDKTMEETSEETTTGVTPIRITLVLVILVVGVSLFAAYSLVKRHIHARSNQISLKVIKPKPKDRLIDSSVLDSG